VKHKLATTLLVVVALVVATFSATVTTTTRSARAAGAFPVNGCPEDPNKQPPCKDDDAAVLWNDQLLDVIRAYPAATGPTITARALGVLHTATYDAWAAYDPVAKVTRPDGPAQQTTGNTLPDKKEAISYAAYLVLNDLFPADKFPCIPANCPTDGTATYLTPDYLLRSINPPPNQYDPANAIPADPANTTATAAGVGSLAAQAVLNYRRGKIPRDLSAPNPYGDGSNQRGDDPKGKGLPYSDTTGYKPFNDWNRVNDPWRWQPLCVLTAAGVAANYPPIRDPNASDCPDGTPTTPSHYTLQNALTPQWGNITPFAFPSSQFPFMAPGPPKNPDGTYSTKDIATELADTTNLTDVKKAIAEYWADGPRSEFPPGHNAVFAQFLCRKQGNNLDSDTKLFFMLGNAMMDASVAAWWTKYKYDFVRPTTAIREFYKNDPNGINSWLGPNQGYGTVPSQQWMPYQHLTVVTPPFPEYVSGHSTFSAAGASLLALANGGDTFGGSITIKAGSSKFEANTPATDVTLSWPTFSHASNEAGLSRRYGGIHFYSGDIHGRAIGRQVAQYVYSKAQSYIKGNTGK
jgi:PAP2 superfamily